MADKRREVAEQEPDEAPIQNVFHSLAYCLVVSFAQMFSVGGLGIAAFTARDVAPAINASQSDTVWFMAAYSLTGGVFVLIAGSIGDVIGPKYTLMLGWFFTAVWTLISGFATSAIMFDVMRGLAGIGNALMIPCAIALLARAYPPQSAWKNFSFALLGFFAPAGFVVGGSIGAGMTHAVSWKWGYWLYAIVCFAFCIATFVVVPHRLGKRLPNASLRNFDYFGSFLGVAGLLLFAFAWNQAALVGWDTPYTYVLLIIGLLALVGFVVWEKRVKEPVLPPDLWTRPGFTPVIVTLFFGWMSFGVFLYFAPEFIMTFRDVSPLNTTGEAAPLVIGGLVATMTVAATVDHVKVQYFFILSALAFIFGNVMFAAMPPHQIYWAMAFPAFALTSFGPDLSFTAASITISNTVEPHEQGKGGSMVNTMVLYSAGLGMGIAGTIQRYVMERHNDEHLAFRSAFIFALGIATIALIIGVTIRDRRFPPKHTPEKSASLEEP